MPDRKHVDPSSQKCTDKCAAYIDDYLLGKLSPAQMDEMELHYFNCEICLREMQLREKLIEHLRRPGAVPTPADVTEHPRPASAFFGSPLRLAGYIAAAVVILLVLRWWIFSGPTGPASEQETLEKYAARYGDNFQPDMAFEERMRTDVRTASPRVNVLAPSNNTLKQGDLRFQWEPAMPGNTSPAQLELTILDNRLYPVQQFTVENGTFILREPLSPGLYYWTLDSEQATLYRGRFFVLPPDASP